MSRRLERGVLLVAFAAVLVPLLLMARPGGEAVPPIPPYALASDAYVTALLRGDPSACELISGDALLAADSAPGRCPQMIAQAASALQHPVAYRQVGSVRVGPTTAVTVNQIATGAAGRACSVSWSSRKCENGADIVVVHLLRDRLYAADQYLPGDELDAAVKRTIARDLPARRTIDIVSKLVSRPRPGERIRRGWIVSQL